MSNELMPVSEMSNLATAIAKSGLFGMKTPDQALALMAIAQAEGLHPAAAARDYHIIQGRPSLKADAMLARFQAVGGKVDWHDYSDQKCSATFTHPQGGSVTVEWDIARSKQAELGGNGMWKKYPRQMLRARVISEGIRTVFPGVSVGMYTPEEVQDFDEPKNTQKVHGNTQNNPRFEPESNLSPITEAEYQPEQYDYPKPQNSEEIELKGFVKEVILPVVDSKYKLWKVVFENGDKCGTYDEPLGTDLKRHELCEISCTCEKTKKGNLQIKSFTLISGEPLPF